MWIFDNDYCGIADYHHLLPECGNTGGELLIGQLSDDDLGLEWFVYQIDATGCE